MSSVLYFTICAFLVSFLLLVVFNLKTHVNTISTRMFSILIFVNFVSLIIEALCSVGSILYNFYPIISNLIFKLYLVFMLLWITYFTLYIFIISKDNYYLDKKLNKIFNITKLCVILMAVVVFLLPINLFTSSDFSVRYTYGAAVNFSYLISGIEIACMIIIVFINFRRIIQKKYVPVLIFFVLGGLAMFIQFKNPSLLLITSVETYILLTMYFTMENPDTQIIDLLTKNKELTEQSVNEKSNFLFKISQELRKPIKDISKDINLLKEEENKDIEKELIEQIDNSAKCANFIINNITDISSMDVKNSRIREDNYNIKRLFKDIELSTNNNLKNSNKDGKIRFTVKENTSYPETVYGDKIKLKQILVSIINNSIKYTDAGHIDLEIDAIARYDMCRFILTITDTGMGMDISKVNKLLSKEEELTDNMVEENNLNLSLPVVHKLLKVVGGNINITSKENKGTIVTVVINQEINYDSTGLILKDINNYSNPKRRLRVLLVDNNDELERVKKILDEKDVDKVITLFGQDCVDKIEHNEDYDLIIIKDELGNETAFEILDKLKQIPRFKIPVIVAMNKEKEFIKEHFIEDGFKDCIIFNDDSKQMIDILSKYL